MPEQEQADLTQLDWLFAPSVQTDPDEEYIPHPAELYKKEVQLPAPDSFSLAPVKEWSAPGPELSVYNQPVRPYKNPRVFDAVDAHALEVVQTDHESFRDLMWHLIYAKDITHDLEKARAIFIWLCCKNTETIKFGDKVLEGTPEETIKDLHGGKTTVAVAYDLMCRNAGIQSKRVVGYAKTGPSRPGERNRHVWNAVLIGGNWALMEVMWAGSKLKKQPATAELVKRDLEEFFFYSPPHEFVLTHLPEDSLWQLLPRPLSLAEFDNTVHVKSTFSRLGLKVLSHRQAVIQSGPHLTISVGSPQNKVIAVICKLVNAADGKEEINGTPLSRYIMQQTVGNVTTFEFRIPVKGSYIFTIYAKDANSGRKEESFGGVAIYLIDCDGSEEEFARITPYPPCTHSRYGPTEKASNYNLQPQVNGFVLKTVKGKGELLFKLPDKELSFMAKLKSNGKDDKELSRYTMHRVVDGFVIFNILAPATGEFGLEIYCRDVKVDGTSLFHIYQYLIICDELENGAVEPLPALTPGYLGPQASYPSLGLTTVTHFDPFIETGTGNIDVVFATSKPLRMSSQLLHIAKDQIEDNSEFILQQRQEDRVIFKVRMCQTGWYKLQIFGLPAEDPSESLPGIFNYVINCTRASESTSAYPKQYSPWKEGCFLHSPLDGKLYQDPDGKPVVFAVDIPKTSSVSVVIGKEWNQLAMKPSGLWEGEVNMEKHWGGTENRVKLCAKLESGENYSILLEYTI